MNRLNLEPISSGIGVQWRDGANAMALDQPTLDRNKAIAREFAGGFVAINPHSPQFDAMTAKIAAIGRSEVAGLVDQAGNAMARLERREGAVAMVHLHIARLRAVVERLNPGAGDDLLRPRRFLGLLRGGSALTSYFDRYRASETEIAAALAAMATSRDVLMQDTIAIGALATANWPLLAALARAIDVCRNLDARFERLTGQLDHVDAVKAQKIRTSALYEVRQRHGDLLTQMAVSQQSYAMLGMMQTSNLELVKGIDRATTTTITALQTAIIAARTLADQVIVLDRISGLSAAATSLIEGSAAPLAGSRSQIAPDSPQAAEQVMALRSALSNVAAAVDALDRQQQQGRPARASALQ